MTVMYQGAKDRMGRPDPLGGPFEQSPWGAAVAALAALRHATPYLLLAKSQTQITYQRWYLVCTNLVLLRATTPPAPALVPSLLTPRGALT